MKKAPNSLSGRTILGALLLTLGIGFLCTIPFLGTRAQNPASGTVNATGTQTASWVGTTISPGGNSNTESTCIDSGPGQSCEIFTLTIAGTPADWVGKKVQVLLTWSSVANEYDIYIHKGTLTGTLITSAIQGPGLLNQVAYIDPAASGTGVFIVHVVYDTTPASATDPYHGSAIIAPTPAAVPPATPDTGPKVGYENFEAPGVLVPGTALSSGFTTVEYMGRGAGEPSVGANWITGVINFQSDLETEFLTFDDSCNLANPKATWVNRRAPTSNFIDSDPIGFTDHPAGATSNRVFAAELTLLSPDTVKISHSDDDGVTWVPDQSGGLASAVDHETIGGGPYRTDLAAVPPVVPPPHPLYANAVYYCSQDVGAALCARSDDGGSTYGPSVPIYNLVACLGLHGHVKVSPQDGTVYVPNRACGGQSAAVVSRDNGATWTVRPVQNASITNTGASDDPAIGIDSNGKVYFLFAQNGTNAAVATSSDFGATWQNFADVGNVTDAHGLTNIAFPAAVAGDPGRAAVAFYASKAGSGDSSGDGYTGVWHLYVARTFDGGLTWTTTDATPSLPMQRMGLLRGGGGPMDRNLLDFFDITYDRDGRVVVGYVNGCSGGNCAQASVNADGSTTVTGNAYTATATIARQSSGRRMFASKDPAPQTVPGMPFVTQRRVGSVVHLGWSEADPGNNNNSPTNPSQTISNYQILRGTTSGGESATPIATVGGTVTRLDDTTAVDPTVTYYYKVIANNSVGSSCANNEIAAPFVGDTCSGIIIHKNLPSHPESTGGSPGVPVGPTPTPTPTPPPLSPQLLIDYIAVGEPPVTSQLMFKMKVSNLSTVPASSRWRMVWNSVASPDEQFYVGMTTDQNSAVKFEYGTIITQSIPPVVGVIGLPTENPVGTPDAASNFNADGTITILIDKSKVGSPQPGDLLGAVCGRTFNTGDAASGGTFERSTLLVDHTFIKGNTDNSYPPATYTVVGNTTCPTTTIVPVSAVSRKTHGTVGDFDVDLPLLGTPGIECRTGGTPKNFKVVVTFPSPITTITGATVTPGSGGTASVSGSPTVNNTQVTVDLTNVSNAQTLTVNLLGVTDNMGHSGNVAVPMSVLLGDTTADGTVNSADISQTKSQSGHVVSLSNFREDVTADGSLNSADISTVKSKSGTALP